MIEKIVVNGQVFINEAFIADGPTSGFSINSSGPINFNCRYTKEDLRKVIEDELRPGGCIHRAIKS